MPHILKRSRQPVWRLILDKDNQIHREELLVDRLEVDTIAKVKLTWVNLESLGSLQVIISCLNHKGEITRRLGASIISINQEILFPKLLGKKHWWQVHRYLNCMWDQPKLVLTPLNPSGNTPISKLRTSRLLALNMDPSAEVHTLREEYVIQCKFSILSIVTHLLCLWSIT